MKFFLDTANTDDIRKYAELGLVDGVTTNPTIVAREGRDFESVIKEITTIVDGPVSAEVTANEADKMIEQARALAKWANNIVVKIPMTETGLKAVSVLSKEGIKTNVTLVFSVAQGLMAAKAGATFISPFVGRLDDIGSDGVKLIKDLRTVLDNYGLKSEIIAASIRGVQHVEAVALAGSDIATIPAGVFGKMFKHPLTDNGLASFEKDWAEFEASQK
ncbi:fructose-6-phosphate aldolase (plasmid) [Ligilactobacillus salivarius]|uniref:Probable transaldolase n=1 Tax=Ligilactobacillus salivarius TaxID=1624 RepID=A0ABD7YXI3_9LACO|nr:fructose-6-phosphate aldolase [Ligilactobacillus salivarius]WHS05065.1 fructose-6-phosphate aldolase [Ligilactobacillus salivarius]WHS09152.1 fructose-6-phosphate aldolase [Ligilactobacillus salivarius]WHS11175.1 fructose-6-phosphate aldolase [Ligilactobacillus salivarius]WHS15209.1 fructose-6-phosphate aldolase [Ligilactobacillus salivarius]WHS18633.1 fructose-6-phosphate aldolase [Ligilactobacillus salivarius]